MEWIDVKPIASRAVVGAVAIASIGVLAACGSDADNPKTLPAGDQAVCNAAGANNARTVYNVRTQPTDTELKKTAARIYPGSSSKNDAEAIAKLKERCADLGYQAAE